jgi:hypothetical protein
MGGSCLGKACKGHSWGVSWDNVPVDDIDARAAACKNGKSRSLPSTPPQLRLHSSTSLDTPFFGHRTDLCCLSVRSRASAPASQPHLLSLPLPQAATTQRPAGNFSIRYCTCRTLEEAPSL